MKTKDLLVIHNALSSINAMYLTPTPRGNAPKPPTECPDIPGNVIYGVARSMKACKPEIEAHQETMQKLFDKFAVETPVKADGVPAKGPDGKPLTEKRIPDERQAEFDAELEKLGDTEIAITLHKFSMTEKEIGVAKLAPWIVRDLLDEVLMVKEEPATK